MAKKKSAPSVVELEEVDDEFMADLDRDAEMLAATNLVNTAERLLKAKKAALNLRDFIEFMNPHPEFPGDVSKSRYEVEAHHQLIIDMFMAATSGINMRSALSIPPQHGKSTITSNFGPAWEIGRNPHKHIIIAGYGSDFVAKIGARVRAIIMSPLFKQVFPNFALQKGSKSKEYMVTTEGGSLLFVGRGEGTTGNPCDLFIIDDPIKDKKEADSPTYRQDLYEWYSSVVFSRCHVLTPIFIIHTRWHEDDLIGRLCDPTHPQHDAELGAMFNYVNVPAIFEEKHADLARVMGKKVGDALWEKRFPVRHLSEARRINSKTFSALYMGEPSPEDGDFFTKEMFNEFVSPRNIPSDLRIYAASDHALKKTEEADFTCMLIVGVDISNNIWLLDVVWKKMKTDEQVAEMIRLMLKWEPMIWWAEKDHISGAIEPFLKKRMEEEKYYLTRIDQLMKNADKKSKAAAIQGWMSVGKVFWPRYATWYQAAKSELLKFDSGTNDDFVDTIANIGRGLRKMMKPTDGAKNAPSAPAKSGTFKWFKEQAASEKRMNKVYENVGGM